MELLSITTLPKSIEHYIPPTLLVMYGKRYVIIKGVWYPADETITQKDLYDRWRKPIKKEYKPAKPSLKVEVESSTGKGKYLVEYNHNMWSCTCPSFGFRRKCKHIDQVKSKNL